MRRKKFFLITAAALIVSMLSSCGGPQLSFVSGSPSPEARESVSPSIAAEESSPSPSPSPEKTVPKLDNDARFSLFRSFLSDNYQQLSDAFVGGISGIGFIDLDLDGGIEMLVFDAGASTAMGLQIFDITGGTVECVCANMETVGADFGGEHMSDIIVNASYYDDFRLMRSKTTGERFFIVQSSSGTTDFSSSELVRFGSGGGVLTLESLMYKYEEYDPDTGVAKSGSCRIAGKEADGAQYETAYSEFFSDNEDLGYEATGCFLWESSDYGDGQDGLLAMADSAYALYLSNSFLIE